MIGLARLGHSILILSFEKPSAYKEYGDVIRKQCENHRIQWYPEQYHKSPPILSTVFDLLRLRVLAARLHRKVNFDIIHCRSYLTSLVGLWMKRKFGTRFLFDMRGFWADERVDGRIWDLGNSLHRAIYSFFKLKEIEFILQADGVISLTKSAKIEITNWFKNGALKVTGSADRGILDRVERRSQRLLRMPGDSSFSHARIQSKITVIATCVDEDRFVLPRGEDPEIPGNFGISPEDFVLLYLGSLGTWYMLSQMIDFFIELRRVKSTAKFLIITNDDPKQFWSQHGSLLLRDGKNYSDSVIVKNLSHSNVPLLGEVADVGICFIKASFSKKASSPTKVGEMLALGIPVISNHGYGDITDIIDANCGFIIDEFSTDEYRRVVESLVAADLDPLAVRSQGLKFFSLKSGIEAYQAIWEAAVKNIYF